MDSAFPASAWPLHWRVRLAMWLPALAGTGVAAWFAPWPVALGVGGTCAGVLLLWGEPAVRALRRQAAMVTELAAATAADAAAEVPAQMPADMAAPVAAEVASPPPVQSPRPSTAPWPDPVPAEALAAAFDQGAVTVLYRPLRTLPELRLCGVEAELRWRHPLAGLLPPRSWPQPLPDGLLERLLAHWLVEACAQFVRWSPRLDTRDAGTLWLSLSDPWVRIPGLEATLDQATSVAGLAPQRLRLRLSPHLQGRHAVLPDVAQRLRLRGYRLAADGFGAGPASLAHLNGLPVAAVCLDRSFVDRAAHAVPQRLVVESTARMAASLGMQTLADGVASEAQVLALGAMGCQLGLGEVCGPWLEAADWSQRWTDPQVADTDVDTGADTGAGTTSS